MIQQVLLTLTLSLEQHSKEKGACLTLSTRQQGMLPRYPPLIRLW